MVHVKGHFNVDSHLLPFHYHVAPDEEFDHAAHIEEHHRRAEGWASKTKELAAWVGTTEVTPAGIEITVRNCHPQAVNFSDWPVYVSWDEASPQGGTELHELTLPYRNPDDFPSLEEVKERVYGAIVARHGKGSAAQKHFDEIALIAKEAHARSEP